jgi:hypothetical protein
VQVAKARASASTSPSEGCGYHFGYEQATQQWVVLRLRDAPPLGLASTLVHGEEHAREDQESSGAELERSALRT